LKPYVSKSEVEASGAFRTKKMIIYQGQTTALTVQSGMAFCVKSGALKAGDQIHLRNLDGTTFNTFICRQSSSTLELEFGGLTLICRPWSRGDKAVARPCGTTSNWTVTKVVETQAA
jgi:hypothetical protein